MSPETWGGSRAIPSSGYKLGYEKHARSELQIFAAALDFTNQFQ